MWKLPLPTCDSAQEELVSALTFVDGRRVFAYSAKQAQRLFDAYATYDLAKGRPSQKLLFRKLGPRFLQALQIAYDEVQEGRRLAEMRSRLKRGVTKCPYCGFGEVRDLDHHLPRSKYKALSIYARNLIPCCHPCNNKKRQIAGDNPDSQFVHTYLDDLPADRFLNAAVEASEAGLKVTFSILRCASMSAELHERLLFQFARLELNERYQAEVIDFVVSQRTGIEYAAAGGPISLRGHLTKGALNSARDFGLNHWRTALWDGLARCQSFWEGAFRHCFGERHAGV